MPGLNFAPKFKFQMSQSVVKNWTCAIFYRRHQHDLKLRNGRLTIYIVRSTNFQSHPVNFPAVGTSTLLSRSFIIAKDTLQSLAVPKGALELVLSRGNWNGLAMNRTDLQSKKKVRNDEQCGMKNISITNLELFGINIVIGPINELNST